MTARWRPRPPRLTGAGWVLLAASAALLAAGVAADYPELATLGASGVVALGAGLFWTAVPPVLSAERRLVSTRPAEGESVRCQLIVVNPGRRRSRPVEAAEPMAAGPVPVPRIPAGGRHQTEPYELAFPRRGRYVLPPPFLGRSDPLGLLRGGAPAPGQPTTVYVHPRVHPVLVPGVDQVAATPALRGSAAAGTSFHSLRPYVLGDEARRIHWMSSVRLREWVVREERELPQRPRCLVLLDTGVHRYPALALFDEAVRVAASVCVWAIRSGVPADLRAGPAGLVPSATETGVLDVLTTVATTASERPGLAALLPPAPACPTALTLVTGRLTAGEMAAVAAATAQWAAAHVVSIDPAVPAPTAKAGTREPRAVLAGGVPSAVPGSWPVTQVGTSADFAVLWRRR